MMNNRSYGSSYYHWLLSLIDGDMGCSLMLEQLYSMYYVWVFDLDRNRSEAGLNLRKLYAYETDMDVDDISTNPCTVLEMLIALAKEMSEIDEQPISRWFWEMINNLGLTTYNDLNFDEEQIIFIVNNWVTHNYEPNGQGSIFPLKDPQFDCRHKQVYTLMNAYMLENSPIDWRLK